jgi:hypothetical protein
MTVTSRYCHFILFLLLFHAHILAQEQNSQGTFHWEENKNKKIEIAKKFTLEAHKMKLLSTDSIYFLYKKYPSKQYEVNADVFVQRLCNYGNPADNIYGFDNENFRITVISDKNQLIKKEILYELNRIFSSLETVNDKPGFNDKVVAEYQIDVLIDSAEMENPVIKIQPEDPASGVRGLSVLYLYANTTLVILESLPNDIKKIGEIYSFSYNFHPPADNLKIPYGGWTRISGSEYKEYYKKYFQNQ